jgi:hypothetical protein
MYVNVSATNTIITFLLPTPEKWLHVKAKETKKKQRSDVIVMMMMI